MCVGTSHICSARGFASASPVCSFGLWPPFGSSVSFRPSGSHSEGPLVVVPLRCCRPFFVSGGRVHTSSIGSSYLLVAGGCALVLLVVLIFDSGLSSPGFLCGSAMSLRFVALLSSGCPPTVCLATGLVALFLYFALQLALGMQVPVGSFLPYGSHPS